MALLMAEPTDLARTLDEWIKRQRLTVASLSRLADLSRRTLYNIQDGASVTSETIRKIARGLSTDPHSNAWDRAVHAEALHDLLVAGGFDPPTDEVIVLDLEDELLKRVKNRATAAEMRELLDRWPSLSPARRRMLEAAIRAALED